MPNQLGRSRLSIMWRLAWPAIIEQILATMVSYVDTAMVGALGKTASAAVSVNAAPMWLINGVLAGVATGYAVQVSHAVGAGDDEKAKAVIRQGVLASLFCGLAAFALYRSLAHFLPMWLGAVEPVLGEARSYLKVYTYCLIFEGGSAIFSAILRCMGNTKTPLILNTASNVINVILNFFFIYETRTVTFFGNTIVIPGAGMGVTGAALGTVFAWAFAGIVTLLVALRQGDRYAIHRGESFKPDKGIITTAVKLGLPSAAERAMVNIGQVAMTKVVAAIDDGMSLAANTIATTAEGLCYLPAYGIAAASTAMVGQSVGAENREDARAYGSLSAKLGFLLCIGTSICLFLFAYPLASLFNTDPEVVAEAARMLKIVSVSEPFFALSIIYTGALRGARDVRFPMIVGLIAMWGVRIPLAPLLVFGFNLGLAGVWIAMAADLILRGILCTLRWRGTRWERRAFEEAEKGAV